MGRVGIKRKRKGHGRCRDKKKMKNKKKAGENKKIQEEQGKRIFAYAYPWKFYEVVFKSSQTVLLMHFDN